ncbi:hypothetical protein AMK59_4952, partial [Oryctes borbonicus]
MGGQSSRTRRITLENEDPTNVIKVSDEVVNRLRSSEEVRKKAAVRQPPPYAAIPEGPPPPPFYHYEPTLTSLQIRQEAAEDLKKNDDYWANRIQDLEKRHEKMKHVMEDEFKKAMDELEVKKIRQPGAKCPVPCISMRKNVAACYKKHPNEPMKCAKEVQAFTECVDSKRV